MNGPDLLEALKRSGTPEKPLSYGHAYVERHPKATGDEVLKALEAEHNPAMPHVGVTMGTLTKAREMLGGKPLSEFLGRPPKNAKLEEITELAKKIGESTAEKIADKLAEKGVAINLAKPEGAVSAKK